MTFVTRTPPKFLGVYVTRSAPAPTPAPTPPPAPQPPTGMVLWLKGETLVGFANGDPIPTWPDSSGNGLDATAAGAQRPTYVAAGSSAFNAKPAVNINYLQLQSFALPASALFTDFTAGITIVAVAFFRSGIASGNGVILRLGSNGSFNDLLFYGNYPTNDLYVTTLPTFDSLSNPASIVRDTPQIFSLRMAPGVDPTPVATTVEVDGAGASANVGALPNTARADNVIGDQVVGAGTLPFDGQIAELFVYPFTLTVPQRATMAAYLLNKYALP